MMRIQTTSIATVCMLAAGTILFLIKRYNGGMSGMDLTTVSAQTEIVQMSIWDTRRLLENSKYHQPGQTCVTGQGIQNFPPICGNPTCLRDIVVPSSNKPTHVELTADYIELLEKTPAPYMDMAHVNIVNMLTDIQWSHGIYGTVGEIGLFYGKYSMVLAHHTDTERGERFFACDIFDKLGHVGYVDLDMKNKQTVSENWTDVKQSFLENMESVGFSPHHENVAKRLYLWYDSSIYISKNIFLEMDLPSIRLMSIDGFHYDVSIWYELIQIMCVLRNGGIIVLDDITSKYADTVTTALNDFQRMVSSKIISPLILNVNKLYVTSIEWHDTYIKDIEEALKVHTDINLRKQTLSDDYNRNNVTYFLKLYGE